MRDHTKLNPAWEGGKGASTPHHPSPRVQSPGSSLGVHAADSEAVGRRGWGAVFTRLGVWGPDQHRALQLTNVQRPAYQICGAGVVVVGEPPVSR